MVANELDPLQARLMDLNDLVGDEVIKFQQYSLQTLFGKK